MRVFFNNKTFAIDKIKLSLCYLIYQGIFIYLKLNYNSISNNQQTRNKLYDIATRI